MRDLIILICSFSYSPNRVGNSMSPGIHTRDTCVSQSIADPISPRTASTVYTINYQQYFTIKPNCDEGGQLEVIPILCSEIVRLFSLFRQSLLFNLFNSLEWNLHCVWFVPTIIKIYFLFAFPHSCI